MIRRRVGCSPTAGSRQQRQRQTLRELHADVDSIQAAGRDRLQARRPPLPLDVDSFHVIHYHTAAKSPTEQAMPLPWTPRIYLRPQFFKKLELDILAQELRITRTAAAIHVVRFWMLAHEHNNDFTPADEKTIDGIFCEGFSLAMSRAGWICFLPPGHVSVPRYEKYLSKRATRRIERNIREGRAEFRRIDSSSDITAIVMEICNGGIPSIGTVAVEKAEPKSKAKPKTKKPVDLTKFERFYEAYPKKRAKGDAEKAFKSIGVTDELLQTMLDAIAVQKNSEQWSKNNGQYIPYPATWLRAKRWLDEGSEHIRKGGRVRGEPSRFDDLDTEIIGGGKADSAPVARRAAATLFDLPPEDDGSDRSIPY